MKVVVPLLALSVRQPWAWAIMNGKDIENRSWRADNPGIKFRGDVAIHASTGMTRDEYEGAAEDIEHNGLVCPPPAELKRGGIVGVVEIVDVTKNSDSPWFFGPVGLMLANPRPVEFIPAAGALGFFKWKPAAADYEPEPAKWMRLWGQEPPAPAPRKSKVQPDAYPHLSPLERARKLADDQQQLEQQFDADMALFEREQRR